MTEEPIEPEVRPRCPEGYEWDYELNDCVPIKPTPPPPEPEPDEFVTTWPWPLSVIEEWMYEFWNWVGEAATIAVEPVANWIYNNALWVVDSVTIGIDAVSTNLTAVFTDLGTTLSENWESFITANAQGFVDIGTFIQGALDTLNTTSINDLALLGTDIATGQINLQTEVALMFEDLEVFLNAGFNALETITTKGIEGLFESLTGLAGDLLTGFADAVGPVLGMIWEGLGAVILPIAEGIMTVVGDATTGLRSIIDGLINSVMVEMETSLDEDSPPPRVKAISTSVTTALLDAFKRGIPEKRHSPPTFADLQEKMGTTVATLTGVYVATAGLSMAMDGTHPFKKWGLKSAIMDILHAFSISDAIGPMVQSEVWAGLTTPLRMRMKQKYPYDVPGYGELARMANQGVITADLYNESVSFHGFDTSWATRTRESNQKIPSFGDLSKMKWRGKLNIDEVKDALRFNLMREDFIEAYAELTVPTIGAGDLVTMVVREAFVERSGDEEMPETFVTEMAKIGFTRTQCLYYWRKHWNYPALGNVYDMFHREIEMPVSIEEFLKIADYAPEWREPLKALSWKMPTTINARWLFKWGQIDRDDLADLIHKDGLTEEWVERVTDAIAKNTFLAEINRLRDNAKNDFKKGLILEDQLYADITGLGYSDELAEFHIQDAKEDLVRELKIDAIDNFGDGYIKDIITEDELKLALASYIINPEVLESTLTMLFIRKHRRATLTKVVT